MVFNFKNQYLQGVYDKTAKCYANEPEFLQAVGEVLELPGTGCCKGSVL